jgi:type IV secretory pathway TraG/TraD family ATPase VirD4
MMGPRFAGRRALTGGTSGMGLAGARRIVSEGGTVIVTATQWSAAMLGYQPQDGAPWLIAFDVPVYRPWALFDWWYSYKAHAPEVFDKAGMLAGGSGFLVCGAAVTGSLWRACQNRKITTYGSSRSATQSEIHEAGLLKDAGVFLGRQGGDYLRHDGPEYVMAFTQTRSGEGVGLVRIARTAGWHRTSRIAANRVFQSSVTEWPTGRN